MEGEWLLPFQGRNPSSAYDQNFVWRRDNVYVMDNHRAALWCWCQHIEKDSKYNLLHIDRHYDALQTLDEEALAKHLPDPWEVDLQVALDSTSPSVRCSGNESLCLRYDNYLSILVAKWPEILGRCVLATHKQGNPPRIDRIEFKPYKLLSDIGLIFKTPECNDDTQQWICNIDLDYFFRESGQEGDHSHLRRFSTAYVRHIFSSLKDTLATGKIAVLTMALSPECCGGWANAEKLAYEVCQIMDIPFMLP